LIPIFVVRGNSTSILYVRGLKLKVIGGPLYKEKMLHVPHLIEKKLLPAAI
jgi:hypothetical protein